jgi:hypothetical protein
MQHTAIELKSKFKNLAVAKAHFAIKARSWEALACKLNVPTLEDLKAQLEKVQSDLVTAQKRIAELQGATSYKSDLLSWALTDEGGTLLKSPTAIVFNEEDHQYFYSNAKARYNELAKRFHPDAGGTSEQMANLAKCFEHQLVLIRMNEGMDL